MYVTACKFVIGLIQRCCVPVEIKVCQLNAIMVPRETAELEKLDELTKMLELLLQPSYYQVKELCLVLGRLHSACLSKHLMRKNICKSVSCMEIDI